MGLLHNWQKGKCMLRVITEVTIITGYLNTIYMSIWLLFNRFTIMFNYLLGGVFS